MERKNGGGQDARATVGRASCPKSPIAKQSANRTVVGGPPVPWGRGGKSAEKIKSRWICLDLFVPTPTLRLVTRDSFRFAGGSPFNQTLS